VDDASPLGAALRGRIERLHSLFFGA